MINLQHVPREFLPRLGTQAYQVLNLLSDGLVHPYSDLLDLLAYDPRSPLQELRGEKGGFWMISRLSGDPSSKRGAYQLDSRHLSGCKLDDSQARQERKRQFLEDSKTQAEREAARLPNAIGRLSEIRPNPDQGDLDFDQAG